MSKSGSGAQWFKFYAARWLNSATVRKMSVAERGIFIDVICYCWVFGSISSNPWQFSKSLQIHYRSAVSWLSKYSESTLTVHPSGSKYAVRKLDKLQDLVGKTSADEAGRVEKSRLEKSTEDPKQSSKQAIKEADASPENLFGEENLTESGVGTKREETPNPTPSSFLVLPFEAEHTPENLRLMDEMIARLGDDEAMPYHLLGFNAKHHPDGKLRIRSLRILHKAVMSDSDNNLLSQYRNHNPDECRACLKRVPASKRTIVCHSGVHGDEGRKIVIPLSWKHPTVNCAECNRRLIVPDLIMNALLEVQ